MGGEDTSVALAQLAGLTALVAAIVYPCLKTATSALRSAVKTSAVAALACVALLFDAPLVALALGLSSVGDFALSRPGDRAFLIGMAAFGAAHVVYSILIWALPGWALPPIWALAALGLYALLMVSQLWPATGRLRLPVMTYIVIIALMAAAAVGAPSTTILAGAVFFVLSDSVLAYEQFLSPSTRGSRLVIWANYWVAQVLLMIGLVFA